MRDNANIEKNCLVDIARSVNDVDIVKKKLTVE